MATKNQLQLGSWKDSLTRYFDLSHVNEALDATQSKTSSQVIGADVLMKGKAVVDYYNHYLYLLK
jgi:hypothetical protein